RTSRTRTCGAEFQDPIRDGGGAGKITAARQRQRGRTRFHEAPAAGERTRKRTRRCLVSRERVPGPERDRAAGAAERSNGLRGVVQREGAPVDGERPRRGSGRKRRATVHRQRASAERDAAAESIRTRER